ncbi:WD40 repeat protein [Ancylomarina subtilis]|uniref:WD40 repeat protein n=1 Tax=Ancylomarina subtilis TaxID=1639035 RepID=A0A4Q7VKW0_9BACT|nr:carboxypeptidase regulatory-like domain-containing protein [Ancylomarina subtilis]RZT96891.1 WD40 repeat protein [Ancylomarina subtilis]
MNIKLLTTIFVAIVFSLSSSLVSAQNRDLSRGQHLFAKKEYKLAIPYLKKYTQNHNDKSVKRNLIFCYIETNQDNKALILAQRMANASKAEAEDFLNYANLLKKVHKYVEAKEWYLKYSKLKPSDNIVLQHIQACNLINEIIDDSLYIAKPININTQQTDYSTSLYNDGLIFVSGRPNKYSKQINKDKKDHYFNLYFTKKIGSKYAIPKLLSEDLSTKYNEGSASFSANEKFIYFTRNKGTVDINGQAQLNIYMSRFAKGKWDKPELFQYAGDDYSTGHPSISKDGKLLFFISNMPGGYGGTDIYYCRKQGFSWGPPINLGPAINTTSDEMFPYICEDGYLYFASSGHIGFGGLDIFKTTFEKNHWKYPVNIGFPFNSSKDDFAYIFDFKNKIGYFSSNRNGNDDIFEFEKNIAKLNTLKGVISKIGSTNPIDSVEVFLVDRNIILDRTYNKPDGSFKFNVFKDQKYSLIIQKKGFKTKRVLYFPQNLSKNKNIKIRLEESPWANIKAFVKNQFSSKPIKNANVEVVNKTYRLSTYCNTDSNGNFSADVDPGNYYDLIVSKPGYYTTVLSNYTYDEILSVDLIKTKGNQTIELHTSTFHNGGWLLTEITKGELNNVIEILNHNPDILIEVRASTKVDSGNRENKELCLKRATEAKNYMISQGIPANRIKTKAIGFNTRSSCIVVKLVESF